MDKLRQDYNKLKERKSQYMKKAGHKESDESEEEDTKKKGGDHGSSSDSECEDEYQDAV